MLSGQPGNTPALRAAQELWSVGVYRDIGEVRLWNPWTLRKIGVNRWDHPAPVGQEGGPVVPSLWAAVELRAAQGCVLSQTLNTEGEMQSACPICTQPALPLAVLASSSVFCDHICLPLPQL